MGTTWQLGTLRAVLLDNNGTCFDDLEQVAFPSAAAIFDHYRVPRPTLEQYRSEISSDFTRFYWEHGIPTTVSGAEMNVIRKAFYKAHALEAEFRPRLEYFLQRWQARGLVIAMVSAEIGDILRAHLERAKLNHYFDDIRPEAWPKQPALVRTLVRLGVMPEHAVYVDDSVEGVTAARNIGLRTIGFTNPTAYTSEARLLTASPDAVAPDFEAVDGVLRSWS